MKPETRFALRLFASQGFIALLAFGFAAFFASRLLVLDAAAAVSARSSYLLGFCVHVLVLGIGTVRETQRNALVLQRDPADARPPDVYYLYRVSLHLVGFALIGCVLSVVAMSLAPIGDAPLAVRGSVALLGFNALIGLHLGGYVMLRHIVGGELTHALPAVAGQASRLHSMAQSRTGTISLRMALGVGVSVYFVAQGALLQTGAHLRAALEEGRLETARDLETVLSMASPEVRSKIEPLAHAASMSASRVSQTPSHPAGAPAPLRGRGGGVAAGFLFSLLISLGALGAGSLLGRSYAGALRRVAREIRGMGEEAQGVRAELLDTSRYRDVTDLLLAVGELGYLFQRFAIAKNTAAVSNIRTERMRAQFLTSMSHDLKAPMNAVLGFAELLSRHPLSAGQHESVTIIKQRGEELMLLIQTVLDSARLEAQSFVLSPEPHVLEQLVQASLERSADLGNDGEVEVLADLTEAHDVSVDGERVRFAILLLLRTAMRLTSAGLAVYVRVVGRRSLGQVELVIESSGGTLSPAELSRVFEAFHYTADARKFGSLGLGLSLAQSIVVLSRGAIEVSSADNGALCIVVRLPTQRDTDPALTAADVNRT